MRLSIIHKPIVSGFLSGSIIFLLTCMTTMVLFNLNDRFQFQLIQKELINLARIAAKDVKPDEHLLLTRPEETNSTYYQQIITPLVELHNSVPDILYIYTMREIGGKLFYVLDTANDERLTRKGGLNKSKVMEQYEFDANDAVYKNWLPNLHNGEIDIDDEFHLDDGHYLISASVPIFDEQNKFFGLLGVDFDVGLYEQNRQTILNIALIVITISLFISVFIGRKVYTMSVNLEKTHAKLYRQAHTDFLTGACNRRYFIELAERELSRSRRFGHSLSLLMIDIDYFKKINDKYGHLTGDEVLIFLVKLIHENMRSNDILARFGGEEFSMLLPDTDSNGAEVFCERIQKKLAYLELKSIEGENFTVQISIGISQYQIDSDLDGWIHQADDALYKAKAAGRNQYKVYKTF